MRAAGFLAEMIELFAMMAALQFVEVGAEGTVFRRSPNPKLAGSGSSQNTNR